MTNNPYDLIVQLNEAFGHTQSNPPAVIDNTSSNHRLRFRLIEEEFDELALAFKHNDTIGYADALMDLLVVIFGDIYTKGWDFPAMFSEVHRANMSKLDDDGKPIYRSDNKVLKGPHYIAPDLTPYLPHTTQSPQGGES